MSFKKPSLRHRSAGYYELIVEVETNESFRFPETLKNPKPGEYALEITIPDTESNGNYEKIYQIQGPSSFIVNTNFRVEGHEGETNFSNNSADAQMA